MIYVVIGLAIGLAFAVLHLDKFTERLNERITKLEQR